MLLALIMPATLDLFLLLLRFRLLLRLRLFNLFLLLLLTTSYFVGVWLRWRFGPLSLFPIKRGGLAFCHRLVVILLTLVVQIPHACEGQRRQGH